ncbi:hypothetical protein KJ836_01965 [Patescibacteria group bacterium]|nr:hypothetical protein [Patescibacteria group bacterium]
MEINKQILKDSALVVADQIASSIPVLNIAWGLSKALYGAGLKIRQQKALEWVEMVRDNPAVFTQKLLEQEEFQDGFVYALEKYLLERNEDKKSYFKNIFLGYAQANSMRDFPLEKFIHTLSQLNEIDIEVIRDIDLTRTDKNYQIYGNEERRLTNIFNLISLGILHSDPSSRLGPMKAPFVWISEFGREFIKYLKTAKS